MICPAVWLFCVKIIYICYGILNLSTLLVLNWPESECVRKKRKQKQTGLLYLTVVWEYNTKRAGRVGWGVMTHLRGKMWYLIQSQMTKVYPTCYVETQYHQRMNTHTGKPSQSEQSFTWCVCLSVCMHRSCMSVGVQDHAHLSQCKRVLDKELCLLTRSLKVTKHTPHLFSLSHMTHCT